MNLVELTLASRAVYLHAVSISKTRLDFLIEFFTVLNKKYLLKR